MGASFDYALNLIDRMSGPAGAAAGAVDRLTSEMDRATRVTAAYQRQLTLAKSIGDIEGFRRYTSLVAESKQKTYALGQELEQLPKVSGPSLASLATGAGSVLGPLEAIVKVEGAVVAGFVAIGVAGAALAIEAVESRDRIEALFDAMGEGPDAGKRTIALLDDLSRSGLPGTRKELADTARAFEAMNLTDLSVLRGQIVATESATAIMGKSGGEAYEKLIGKAQFAIESNTALKLSGRQLSTTFREVGVSVQDVATHMGVTAHALTTGLKAGTVDAGAFANALRETVTERGAKPLANAGLEIGVVWKKGLASIEETFEGVDIKPFAAELRGFFDIFDQANPSGQVMKSAIGGAFTDIFGFAKDATHSATILFLTIELDALKAYNALWPLIHAVKQVNEALAEASIRARGGTSEDVANFAATGDKTIKGASDAITVGGAVASETAKATGAFIADGLTQGMFSRLKLVTDAGRALVSAAHGGAVDGAEVHSPSRLFMRFGVHLPEGVAEGVERGTPHVRDAMGEMVQPPVLGRPGADGRPGEGGHGGQGGPGSASPGGKFEIHVHMHGAAGAGAEEAGELAAIKIVELLESLGLQMGGGQVRKPS